MKTSRKLAAALAVFAAGSVFFGSLPAKAEGIELNEMKIVVSRHHGDMPPPPHHPEHFGPHGHGPHHPEHFGPHGHGHVIRNTSGLTDTIHIIRLIGRRTDRLTGRTYGIT